MEIQYLSFTEIVEYIKTDELPENKSNSYKLYLCSIAELVQACEEYKKHSEYLDPGRSFFQNTSQEKFEQSIFIAELDEKRLLEALFESDGTLWQEAIGLSPLHSLRILSMRPSEKDTVWWNSETYQKMEEMTTELST